MDVSLKLGIAPLEMDVVSEKGFILLQSAFMSPASIADFRTADPEMLKKSAMIAFEEDKISDDILQTCLKIDRTQSEILISQLAQIGIIFDSTCEKPFHGADEFLKMVNQVKKAEEQSEQENVTASNNAKRSVHLC